jgi:hypothetical protein
LLPQDYLDALNAEERASRYGFEQMSPDGPFTQVAVDGQTYAGTSPPAAPGSPTFPAPEKSGRSTLIHPVGAGELVAV